MQVQVQVQVKTFRAKSVREALQMIRRDLGPRAAVLQTREVRGTKLLDRIIGSRYVEVTASTGAGVPSRLRPLREDAPRTGQPAATPRLDAPNSSAEAAPPRVPPAHEQDYRGKFREDLKQQLSDLQSLVGDLCRQRHPATRHPAAEPELPEALFQLFTHLLDVEIGEDLARELVERVRPGATEASLQDPVRLKARLATLVEQEIGVCGPIRVTPGQRRLVALVGPTGVGKTTTIAKLAANFRLREKRRVGLITVDTYRIAAVEQLRTYADIIDLPMEVVATPREMREAVSRLRDLDLILMDTAGRSPRDEVKIQELKSLLAEAHPDEVHLVLSSVTSATGLTKAVEHFSEVGLTAVLLTKLDEATGLGNLIPLSRNGRLPLSYVTNGQNVPDDIQAADARRLARDILGIAAQESSG